MKIAASMLLASTALTLAACQPASHSPAQTPSKTVEVPQPYHLPATVAPKSDRLANFGIGTSTLPERDAEIVQSAWRNFKLILAGKEPECSVTFALTDGGSVMYDCDTYEIMRVKALASKDGTDGYDYGPALDFRNGNKIERLKFYSRSELAELERAH